MKSLEQLVNLLENGIDMDDELAIRKAFLEFNHDDVEQLRKLHKPMASARTAFVNAFYEHLKRFPATARLIEDPETLARLKQSQSTYFDSLTEGRYEQDYVHNRLRVGTAHQRSGLEPKWYLGAYSRYLCALIPEIHRLYADEATETVAAAYRALIRVLFLDIGLAIDTYNHADRRQILALKNYAEKIIGKIPSGLLVLSDQLMILSANPPVGALFGVTQESLRGRQLGDVIPDLSATASEALASDKPVPDFYTTYRGNGDTRHLEIRFTLFDDDGADGITEPAPRLLLVINDLTEKEWLRRTARESETRMRAILENLAEGVVSIDEQGTINSFNRAAQQIFGYSAVEVVGKNIDTLMPEPHHSAHRGYLEHYVQTGESRCLGIGMREVPALHKDGTVMPIELSTSETRLGGQRLFIGIVRDISERHQAEQEMRKLSSALEQTADSVVITDKTGVIEYVNPAFEDATGFSREETIGNTPALTRSGAHDRSFYQSLWDTILNGEVFQAVFINRRKDGSQYYEEKSITPVKNADGIVTHFVSTGKDITDRMRTQERLDYLAHHDPLTNLPNRTLFMDRLQHALAGARRHGGLIAVLFLDLDRFKIINDTLGHDVGDRLLQDMARRLSDNVREGDTIARFGGDECAVLVEDAATTGDIPAVASKTPGRPGPTVRAGWARVVRDHQHRHQRIPQRRRRRAHTAQTCGRGHVRGQGERPQHLPVLHRRHERPSA